MSDDAAPAINAGAAVPPDALSRELLIINKRGLHARASAKFVQLVEKFEAEVWVTRGGETVGGTIPTFNIMGGTNGLVSVDAMQEFLIQTSSFAPEYGRSPGAQISIVTKSGGNDFHGGLFEYLRNSSLDARNFFDAEKSPLRLNQFGGRLGGLLR